MMYHFTGQSIQCSWENCKAKATTQVFNSDMSEMAWLCNLHKKAAHINLEQHDKIRAPNNGRKSSSEPRPGIPPSPQVKPERRPTQDGVTQWEKIAADKAEKIATPVNPPIIGDLPTPRGKK